MKYNLRKGLYLLMAILCVGWVQAQTTNISTLAELNAAISSADENGTVTLTGNITDANAASGAAITISKKITLDGANYTISGSAQQNIISITTAGVTLKDVTIINNTASNTPSASAGYNDVTVYRTGTETETILQNVNLQGKGGLGLVVQGSKVKLDNVNASNHVWGSVNLQANGDIAPALTVEGNGKLAGLMQIYVDKGQTPAGNWVSATGYSYTDAYKETYASGLWTNKINSSTGTYLVDYASELQAIVSFINMSGDPSPFTTVKLAAGEYELTEQLTLNKKIELVGATNDDGTPATTLKRTTKWSGTDNSSKHMVCITAPEATVSNLIIDGNGLTSGMATGLNEGSGIQVYENNTNVNLNNVTVKNMLAAGLVVNSAKVTLTNFHTEGNAWGGVNVDKKATNNPVLTVGNGCSFAEINKIWDESKVENAVIVPTGSKWAMTTVGEVDYWTNSRLSVGAKQAFNITNGQLTPVYANGHAVTISDAEEGKVKITADEDASDYLVLDEGSEVIVFGGSRDKATGNTSVKMVSGTVNSIFGGGYGLTEDASADVSGTTKVTIEGGNVAIHVYSGSYGFGKIENGVINISGANTTVRRLQAGGAAVGSGITLVDNYTDAKNAVKNVEITVQNATITEGMGTGGGFGYSYTGTSTVNVTNAKLGSFYGTLSNGYADNITANLTGCSFEKKVSWFELGTINRGKVKTASFTFDKCSFPSANDFTTYTFTIGAIEGWGDSDTTGDPAPAILGSVSYTFTDCTNVPTVQVGEGVETADVTLTGAPALLKKFRRGNNVTTDKGGKEKLSFEIPSDKTWTFNNGLELASDVNLTNKGNLVVMGVCTVAKNPQLETVLGEKASVSNIVLAQGTYGDFTVAKNDVTISGNKEATITGTVTVSGSGVVLKEAKFSPTSTGANAVKVEEKGSLTVSHNYWGETPNFATLIGGKANPYPYYSDAAMTEESLVYNTMVINDAQTLTSVYEGCDVTIKKDGYLTLNGEGLQFGTITIEEGGQLKPLNGTTASTAKKVVFKSTLQADAWKALGTPFASSVLDSSNDEVTLAEQKDDGVWFASLKDNQTPEIEVKKSAETNNAGLWAANDGGQYQFVSSGQVELTDNLGNLPNLANGEKLKMIVNQNTYAVTLSGKAIYVFNASTNTFDRKDASATVTIAPFESFVIADIETAATLRSIGTTDPNATGNEFVVKEGYYLTTERGAIVVHTAEPMELYVVAVSGAVVYRGTVTDGERIAVPTGFYAVNGQMVRVK